MLFHLICCASLFCTAASSTLLVQQSHSFEIAEIGKASLLRTGYSVIFLLKRQAARNIVDTSYTIETDPDKSRAETTEQAMAGVRDPEFWRRFSIAVHMDEEKGNTRSVATRSDSSVGTMSLKHT